MTTIDQTIVTIAASVMCGLGVVFIIIKTWKDLTKKEVPIVKYTPQVDSVETKVIELKKEEN
jgi:hypothetical protein